MPNRVASYDCALPPSVYWALREDDGFEQYSAGREGNFFEVTSRTVDDEGTITRSARVTAEKNPIPSSMRKMLGCTDGFTFVITEKWRPDRYDAECPMTFVTEPAVLKDRIFVSGSQWCEPNSTGGSTLYFSLTVTVKMSGGVGSALARGIASGTFAAYKASPIRASEFVALRRASLRASGSLSVSDADIRAAGVAAAIAAAKPGYTPPPFVPAPSLGGAMGGAEPVQAEDVGTAADVAPASDVAVVGGVDGREAEVHARRQRARLRWRIALMSVRFRKALEAQQLSRRRIMAEGWVDAPKTEGYGPTRATTFRVCTQVRACMRLGALPRPLARTLVGPACPRPRPLAPPLAPPPTPPRLESALLSAH